MSNTPSNLETNVEPISILKWDSFQKTFFGNPSVVMVWGDIGTGKTSLALQLARISMLENKRVLYLYSKKDFCADLFSRLLNSIDFNKQENLIIQTPENFNRQNEMISNLLLQTQQMKELMGPYRIGLIVVDEISSLYLIEMGSEKKNEVLNQRFTFQLATLSQICQIHQIPILLLNSFTSKKDESDELQDIPYGGKIVDYWVQTEIKIERTSQYSRRLFHCEKNSQNISIPNKWSWLLSENGFY